MTAPMRPPISVGEVIRLGEPDYLYGVGPLILSVTEVGTVQQHSDGPWLNVRGVQLRADGSPMKPESRVALIRVRALLGRQEKKP